MASQERNDTDLIEIKGVIGSTKVTEEVIPVASQRVNRSVSLSAVKYAVSSDAEVIYGFDGIKTNSSELGVQQSLSGKDSTNGRHRTVSSLADVEEIVKELVHKPVKRFEWNEEHTKVFRNGGHMDENWLEEFLDLILVASMLKLGDGLHYCGIGMKEIAYVSLEFLVIFKTRFMIDEFMWNFFMDDVWNQFLFLLYIVGVYVMALMTSYSIDDAGVCTLETFHLVGFFYGLIITRGVLFFFWLVELYFDDTARGNFYMYPTRNMLSVLMSAVGVILNQFEDFDVEYSYYVIVAIVITEYYLQFYKCIHKMPLLQLNEYWPFNKFGINSKDHEREVLFECDEELGTVQTRMGFFMLIVIGESVIQLLLPSFDVNDENMVKQTAYLTLMGLACVWSISKQFFDAAQRVAHDHALRRCMQSGYQWLVMHVVAGLSTFFVGIGLKLLYKDLKDSGLAKEEHELLLSVGLCGTVFAFTYMRFLHKGFMTWPQNKGRLAAYAVRFLTAFIHLSVAYWTPLHNGNPGHIVLIHTVISFGLNSLDLYGFKPEHHMEGPSDGAQHWHDVMDGDHIDENGKNVSPRSPDSRGSAGSSASSDTINVGIGQELRRSATNLLAAMDPFSSRKNRAEGRSTPTGSSSNLLIGRPGSRPASSTNLLYNSGSSSNLMRPGSSSNIVIGSKNSGSNLLRRGSEPQGTGGRVVLETANEDEEDVISVYTSTKTKTKTDSTK